MVGRTAYGKPVDDEGMPLVDGPHRCSVCGDVCSKGVEIEDNRGVYCSWECRGRVNG